MRYVVSAFGTHSEIEAELRNAVEAQGRSARRRAEAEQAALDFLAGEKLISLGSVNYLVVPDDDPMVRDGKVTASDDDATVADVTPGDSARTLG